MSAVPTDFVYDNARQLFATGQINWPAAAVYAMVVSQLYVPSLADVHVSDIPVGSRLVSNMQCTSVASVKGICSCLIPEINAVVSPYKATALVLYVKGSNDANSPLVYYSSTGPGFPFALDGTAVDVGFDQLSGGFFQV